MVEIVYVDDEVSQERSGTLYKVARISLYPCMHVVFAQIGTTDICNSNIYLYWPTAKLSH